MSKSAKKNEKTVCGIIMPISHTDDDHTESHWREVKEVISEAIRLAECIPQPVWEGGSHDIIQSKILQNIFENEIVVCDISTRNPNVMLEMGMRLTTKKPTLIIAEEGTKLPFDTSIIHTEFYDPKLQFRAATEFIKILSAEIARKLEAVKSGDYRPYMEAFEFETVEPSKKTVSSEERMSELVSDMERIVDTARAQERAKRHDDAYSKIAPDWERITKLLSEANQSPEPKNTEKFNDLLKQYAKYTFEVGDIVTHEKFGVGEVISIEGQKVVVDFESGRRRLLSSFLKKVA